MAASVTINDRRRLVGAPPPTPIATGKGARSAAVDDRVLVEFLEGLRIPELTLPGSVFPPKPSIPAPEIDLPSLAAGEDSSVRRLLAAAAGGAFRIISGDATFTDKARSAVEMGVSIFGISEGKKSALGNCFRRREGIGEEFCWNRWMGSEMERIFAEVLSGGFRAFREKIDSVASKMEMVAHCIQQILSNHVKNESHSIGIHWKKSILCLKKYDSRHIIGNQSDSKTSQFYALSLHLCRDDHETCTPSPLHSASFSASSSSILVTIDEQLQELRSGELKSGVGEESLSEPSYYPNMTLTLEFVLSPTTQTQEVNDPEKIITIIDQLLLGFAFALLYKLWAWLSFRFKA